MDLDPTQLVLWPLMGKPDESSELMLDDLPLLERLLAALAGAHEAGDSKIVLLEQLLQGPEPTLVFSTARETVDYLRQRLSSPRLAWCTGSRSGIGRLRTTRESVLHWFRPSSAGLSQDLGPITLLATDVAAEGLNLQRARRVIHYDLPWTAVRLDQRDGRALRLGSIHSSVEVITFHPPPALEERLRQDRLLVVKRGLPARAGLGAGGRGFWRWRDELVARWPGPEPGHSPIASVVEAKHGGLLLGLRIQASDGSAAGTLAAYLPSTGSWSEDPGLIEQWFDCASRSPGRTPTTSELQDIMKTVTPFIQGRLRRQYWWRWSRATPSAEARRALRRLHRLARDAARHRDSAVLRLAEHGIAFARRGHTAGEAMLLADLAGVSAQELRAKLKGLKTTTPPEEASCPVLCAALLFQPPRNT